MHLIEDEPKPEQVGYFEGGHMATEAFDSLIIRIAESTHGRVIL